MLEYKSPYWLSEKNTLCNDTRNETVKDKIQCREAFADIIDVLIKGFQAIPAYIEHNINDQFVSPNYPSGCIVVIERFGTDRKYRVKWNEISNGSRNDITYQICKTGIS